MKERRANPQFKGDVVAARFMMVDQIILLGVSNKIHAYKYALDDAEEADKEHLESTLKNYNR